MIFVMLCHEIFIAIDNSNPVSLYFNWVLIERLKKLETYSSLEMVFILLVKPIIKKMTL
jgi:hypothetical protein